MRAECEKRLFLGIPAGQEIVPILTDIQSSIGYNQGKIIWILSENIHMTISFIGNILLDDIPKLTQTLKDALNIDHFGVSIEKTGAFPSTQYPKILWLGVGTGQQTMIALHEQVEKAVVSFKTGRREKGFSPHVTIGRTARSYGKMDVLPFLKYVYSPIELDVNSVALYESLLLPQGAKYKVLTEFLLN